MGLESDYIPYWGERKYNHYQQREKQNRPMPPRCCGRYSCTCRNQSPLKD